MKKKIALLLSFLVAFVCFSSAKAEENLFPAMLSIDYYAWADILGVSLDKDDMSTEKLDENSSLMRLDMLTVQYDSSNLDFKRAFMFYRAPGFSNAELELRCYAFFIAIEHGAPADFTLKEAKEKQNAVSPIMKDLLDVLQKKANDLESGKVVPFHVGSSVNYFVRTSSDGMILIIAE